MQSLSVCGLWQEQRLAEHGTPKRLDSARGSARVDRSITASTAVRAQPSGPIPSRIVLARELATSASRRLGVAKGLAKKR